MSMITEEVTRLRELADRMSRSTFIHENIFYAAMRALEEAAKTIEQLAAKLQALNKKTMFSYLDGVADSMKEDAKELETYKKAFEDIRAEIRQKAEIEVVDGCVMVREYEVEAIIDKHDPSKAGKESK